MGEFITGIGIPGEILESLTLSELAECYCLINVMCFLSKKTSVWPRKMHEVYKNEALTIPLCLLKISVMSQTLHLFLSFHSDVYNPVAPSNEPTLVVSNEPATGDIDTRGIIEERRRLGEVNAENLPVVEPPTPQLVTKLAAPNNFKEAPTVSGLDLKNAEERQDKGRKEVPKKTVAKRDDSKASGSGIGR